MTSTEYRVVPIEKEDGYEHPYQEFTNLEAAREFAYENEHIYCEIRKVTVETFETIRTPEPVEEPKQELTPAEIKKAWETMKKNLKKEFTDSNYYTGYVMNARQIANHTATKTVTKACSYDEEIASQETFIKNAVRWYKPEDYEAVKQSHEEYIELLKVLKRKYGTTENRAKDVMKTLEQSYSLAEFEKVVGDVRLSLEIDSENYYKIRFTY